MRAARWTVGVDFGGTFTKVGLVDRTGRLVGTRVLSSGTLRGPASFVEALAEAVSGLARAVGSRPSLLRGLGIGAPGCVSLERGLVHSLTNVPGWHDVPLRRLLERRLDCRCLVDNDANVYTLGEWRFGAGRGSRALVGLTLGTGVGGGLVLDGRVYRGASGTAGELGHVVVDRGGARCACGRRGCLEAFVGTAAILRRARAAIRRGAQPLGRLSRAAGHRLSPELVSRAARAGDAAARAIWEEIGSWLGIAAANVAHLVNPDRIVIGGGVANAWPLFIRTLRRTMREETMDLPGRAVRVVRAELGNSAGILGAAVLVWQEIGQGYETGY